MDWYEQTVKTYNDSAKALSEYYDSLGPQIYNIELALSLAGVGDRASVVEIGCGNGRDAAEIVKRVKSYEGVDPSYGLLKIARRKLPSVSFVEADALTYNYPGNLDVIFAFASLLHIDRTDMQKVFTKVASSLRSGGIFYIFLKQRDSYQAEPQTDKYGRRMFYYYSPDVIKEIAGDLFGTVHEMQQEIAGVNWLTLGLKRL